MGEVRIGTSGYSFPDWVGPFYPAGTKNPAMLQLYAREFDTVEVNYTYYRMPTEKTIAGMAAKTPEGFRFFVKAHESFTHQGDLSGRDEFLGALAPMKSAGKLAGLLFQFPQSFKNTEEGRKYLKAVADGFKEVVAVEFRDRSWAAEPVYKYLESLGLCFVSVDEPEVSTLFPRVGRATGDVGYVRFHSRNAAKWYKGAAVRYDYLYSDAELREWLPRLAAIAGKAKHIYVYFNNCNRAQAAENARRMKAIVKEAGLWTG